MKNEQHQDQPGYEHRFSADTTVVGRSVIDGSAIGRSVIDRSAIDESVFDGASHTEENPAVVAAKNFRFLVVTSDGIGLNFIVYHLKPP